MVRFISASLTDPGRIREENEDCAWDQIYSAAARPPLGLFIVCDGMGGHMGGKFASYWAVEAVKREFAGLFVSKDPRATVVLTEEDIKSAQAGQLVTPKEPPEPDLEALLHAAIQKANYVVYQYACHKPDKAANAGTTITMAVVRGDKALIANAGDSRTYLIRNHALHQISKDHSLIAHLIEEGSVLASEIYTHPQRNVIYRYLGERGRANPDIFEQELLPGDHLMLCSDGLWEMVRNKDLLVSLVEGAGDPQQACQDLIQAANQAGGEDNIAVVVVRVL